MNKISRDKLEWMKEALKEVLFTALIIALIIFGSFIAIVKVKVYLKMLNI